MHDEQDLAARFPAGEMDVFDQIVADHQERIARVVHRLLDGSDDVEDVVQDVFLAALGKLGGFRGRCELSTWLTTIAVNTCRSYDRRQRLQRRVWPWLARQARPWSEDDQQAECDEIHARVRRAVHGLPPKYREAIVLRYFEELPIAEIGEVLGVSTGAVEVRLCRARRRLREMLPIRPSEDGP
ncbi:MAG: hypothetical protein A2V70_01945 [Planctomycetes bacterium RBG_13_63_9]|nr:MAG: hypothetical protein A2V70_01945 [Planctomycetes bacterium RBG_13_63_9]